MCGGVIEGFHFLIQRYGRNPGFTGDVASEHQHHTELANRVSKTEHDASQQTGPRQGQHDVLQCLPIAFATAARRFEQRRRELPKAAEQRLQHERQAEQH